MKKDAAPLQIALLKMGHPQKATPIQTDNACAAVIANDTVKQRANGHAFLLGEVPSLTKQY
jgi:hypothetical protein